MGFEKCSTTALSIWLSHHPNLQSRWLEGRYFDHIDPTEDGLGEGSELDRTWYEPYLTTTLPPLPEGADGVGRYWTFEKSPATASAPSAPEAIARLVPGATLLFATRSPTSRAYSMFLMYCAHYPTVLSAFRAPQGLSYFVRQEGTGAVRFVNDPAMGFAIGPGRGGGRVPEGRLPPGRAGEAWRFLKYPPNPRDFDSYVRYALGSRGAGGGRDGTGGPPPGPNFADNSRPARILYGGFYASYLRRWLNYFPPSRMVVLPSELFYTSETPTSLDRLQETLGLPVYDYTEIESSGSRGGGRFDIGSPAVWLNGIFNSHKHDVPKMLNETKALLDDLYCEENMELSRMLGGRPLPGYSCAEDGIVGQ